MIQQRMQEHWQEEKGCMQKLHTLTRVGLHLFPAALAFSTLSLCLSLILKCKNWRKKRKEKNILFFPDWFSIKLPVTEKLSDCRATAAGLPVPHLDLKPANQRGSKVINNWVCDHFWWYCFSLFAMTSYPFKKKKERKKFVHRNTASSVKHRPDSFF